MSPFAALARNSAWANDRLLGACEALAPGEWDAPRTGFFPSIAATLGHVWQVDRYYLDALTGGGQGRAVFADPVPEGPAALRLSQAALDARLVAFCDAAPDPDATVTTERRDGPVPERIGPLLLHLFQHQVHHRGQAHAMLAGTSVAPPQLDEFFLEFDRHPGAARYRP